MLRPSDVAPKGVMHDTDSGAMHHLTFSRDQVSFPLTGGVRIVFFGVKNDSSRDSFEVAVLASKDPKMDPALCLRTYMNRTEKYLTDCLSGPVFIALRKPYLAVSASTIACILDEAIQLAGLDSSKYTAKCFRPTRATRAVSAGIDPDKARRLGRWKTTSVFFEHYVFDRTLDNYVDDMFAV